MFSHETYRPKTFKLSGLRGISDETLAMHFKLYEGYVEQTNVLNEKIAEILGSGKIDQESMPAYSELTRRLGFEYNGMVLHEYYFGNLTAGGGGNPPAAFKTAAEASYGTFETWKADFVGVCKMRGVGWAICYQDPMTSLLTNHWITLHEVGNVTGFTPVLVVDVWEHAFLKDYAPSERGKYIDACFANVDWTIVEGRLNAMPRAPRERATGGSRSSR